MHGPWLVIVGKTLTGQLVIDMGGTLVTSRSDKEGAAPTWKKGYGLLTELAEASFLFSRHVALAFTTVPAHGRWWAVPGYGGTDGPAGGRAQGDRKSLDAVRASRCRRRRGRPGCCVSEGCAGVRAAGSDVALVCPFMPSGVTARMTAAAPPAARQPADRRGTPSPARPDRLQNPPAGTARMDPLSPPPHPPTALSVPTAPAAHHVHS